VVAFSSRESSFVKSHWNCQTSSYHIGLLENMAEESVPWPKQGPTSYFPSIEARYGRPIGEWQKIIDECKFDKHMAIASYLTSEFGMGHRHLMPLSAGRSRGIVQIRDLAPSRLSV
jgi:hypothetical protein